MASLAIFHKNDDNLHFLKERLDHFPKHTIAVETNDRTTSLEVLDNIHQGELTPPDAIVLDGNFLADAYPCTDAEAIINHHDKLGLKIYIIGYSAVFLSQYDEINIHPGLDIGKNPNSLLRVLDELFER